MDPAEELGREAGLSAGPSHRSGFGAGVSPAFGDEAFDLVDGNQSCSPPGLDRFDERQNASDEG
jgi:hypothetical protein